MEYCSNINLQLFNSNSENDWWDLACLFDDGSLDLLIDDSAYAKFIFFIKDYENKIGFIYLLQYESTNILGLEYGLIKSHFNRNYMFTALILLRNKLKGYDFIKTEEYNREIELINCSVVTQVRAIDDNSNILAHDNGNIIFNDLEYNYYEFNPCKNNEEEEIKKVMKFLISS